MRNYLKKLLIIPIILASILGSPFNAYAVGITIGNTLNGTGSTSYSADKILASTLYSDFNTPVQSGILKSGAGRFWVSSGSSRTRMVVYSDSSFTPNELLAVSDEVTVSNTTEAEISYTFSGLNQIQIVAGTPYWIGVAFEDPGAGNFNYSRGTGASGEIYSSNDTYSDGQQITFIASGLETQRLDAYVTFETQQGATHVLENSTLYRSSKRIDWDGINERAKTGGSPTGSSDTSGSICVWVQPDINLSTNASDSYFAYGGTTTTGGVTVSGLFFIGRRWNSTSGANNQPIVFHRIQGSSTINERMGSSTLSAGNLYFMCVTSNGSTWKMYINGAEETLSAGVGGTNTGDWFGDIGSIGTGSYSIGSTWRFNEWGAAYFDGKEDNIFTTSDTITLAEHQALYNGGKPIHPCPIINCANVRVFYKAGEDTNDTISTIPAAIGNTSTDNMTTENMEDTDIVTNSYY